MAMPVRELELDLEAFEGPFDLLLALVLRDELDLGEVDVAGIVLAFLERLAERDELDLEALEQGQQSTIDALEAQSIPVKE